MPEPIFKQKAAGKTPTTTIVQDSKGNKFDIAQVQKGLIENWMREDIVQNINGNQHVQIIKDEDGQIRQYIFYKRKWIGLQDRTPLVEKDFKGEAVTKKAFVVEKIVINIDREVSTDIIYIDRWDTKKLADVIDQESSTRGQFVKVPLRARELIYFENLRAAAQVGQADYKTASNFDYIRELKLSLSNQEYTETIQRAIDDLMSLGNEYMDGFDESDLAIIIPHQGMTKISNTQAFTGSDKAFEALEKGQIGWLNGIKVYRSHRTNGIVYVTMRGVACAPLINQEVVNWPVKSNSLAIALEFATTLAGDDKLYVDFATIALGDLSVINADIRPKPDQTKLLPKTTNGSAKTLMNVTPNVEHLLHELKAKDQVIQDKEKELKNSQEEIELLNLELVTKNNVETPNDQVNNQEQNQ